MKLIKLLEESNIKSYHIKTLKLMKNNDVENDPEIIWEFLTNSLLLDDNKLKGEILYLYENYYDTPIEDLKKVLDSVNIDFDEVYEGYDDKHIALSHFLDLPPTLIDELTYNHYGLTMYKDFTTKYEYSVGDDDEIESALDRYYEDYIDNLGGIEILGRNMVEGFIEIDSYILNELSYEEAQSEIDGLDDVEILTKAGYDITNYDEDSMLDVLRTAKDELLDDLYDKYKSDIESEGIYWFLDRGYSFFDAVGSFFNVDEDGIINYIRENEDRGTLLGHYDGYQNEQYFNNEWYYIYRV
jgi:hypothetical protein